MSAKLNDTRVTGGLQLMMAKRKAEQAKSKEGEKKPTQIEGNEKKPAQA